MQLSFRLVFFTIISILFHAVLITGCGGGGDGDSNGDSNEANWTIPIGTGTNYRAIHIGGNWGTNVEATNSLPQEYFEYLRDLNVNWIGISVALHVDDSLDSSVVRKYSGVNITTFTDEVLIQTIRAFRKHGFNVYLTLAFEIEEAEFAIHPVQRWQLGDPNMPNEDQAILQEFWPWSINHPDHAQFISDFWESYTQQAVHFGQIAEAGTCCIRILLIDTAIYGGITGSPYIPNADEFNQRLFIDIDGNGLDDGQETQANIYRALFNVMDDYPGTLSGSFLWGMMMSDSQTWEDSFAILREFSVRGKLSEDVVRVTYAKWRE